ncbi:MAG: Flp pilus assembly protein CpaB [Sandaracinus sp.]|nr:Flp pilus assembly protein CpaB [Sandaracinus sp.]MCB9632762.1 Flp pilus assembly protein CpaB [Sandaracinus sp.]
MNRTTLLAGISVAILGGVLFSLHLRHFEARVTGGETISVCVVTAPVEEGQAITQANLGFRDVPRFHVEDRHVRAGQLAQVLGVPAQRNLNPGYWLNWNDVGSESSRKVELSASVAEGQRAFTVELESYSFGKMVAAGDKVDILVTARRPGGTMRLTTVLVQNVLVLAVGQRQSSLTRGGASAEQRQAGSGRGQRMVTLSLNLHESAVLFHALEFAERLALIVRNPEDETLITESIPVTTDLDLVEAEIRAERQFRRPLIQPAGPERIQ